LSAGCEVVVLLADIHGMLDNLKAPIDLVQHRANYYRLTVAALLRAVGISTELKNLTFVLGSSYQKSPEYVLDVYKLSSCITEHEAKRAGAEVVKQTASPPISGLLYPILQVVSMTNSYISNPRSSMLIMPSSMNSIWMSTHNLEVSFMQGVQKLF
jgi:tyrosyl-tRNA synthetase